MLVPPTGSTDSEEWSVLTSMTHGRFGAASAVTASGDVWVIGGMGPNWPNFDPLTSEIVGKIFYKNRVNSTRLFWEVKALNKYRHLQVPDISSDNYVIHIRRWSFQMSRGEQVGVDPVFQLRSCGTVPPTGTAVTSLSGPEPLLTQEPLGWSTLRLSFSTDFPTSPRGIEQELPAGPSWQETRGPWQWQAD